MGKTKAKTHPRRYRDTVAFFADWVLGQGLAVALIGLVTAGIILWVDTLDIFTSWTARNDFHMLMILGFAPLAIVTVSAWLQHIAIKTLIGKPLTGWMRDTLLGAVVSVAWFAWHMSQSNGASSIFSNTTSTAQLLIPTVLFVLVLQARRLLATMPSQSVHAHKWIVYWFMLNLCGSLLVFSYINERFFIYALAGYLLLQAVMMRLVLQPYRENFHTA
ncbi:MAG: hypothetical protein AAFV93_13255 [Chloroflexota bacterium]